MKIWGKIAITCLIVVGITANMENKAISTTAASVFWISLIIGLVQKFKNKNKTKNLPKQEKTSAIKQEKPKKKKIQNICWKCQHKYMSDGWYNWWMGICPKCGANSTGYYLLVVIGTVLFVCVMSCQSKDKTQIDKPETKPVEQVNQKTDELPDFVRDGKLLWPIPVCINPDDYSEYSHAYHKKDTAIMKTYENKRICWMLKAGIKVSILDWHLIKPTKIRVYVDNDMYDLYTSSFYVKGAD